LVEADIEFGSGASSSCATSQNVSGYQEEIVVLAEGSGSILRAGREARTTGDECIMYRAFI
jgi:hypothetical protein